MSTIDENGFQRDRYQDERSANAASWLGYFPDTKTDEQSVNGRIISQQTDVIDGLNAKIQLLLDAFSPYTARGKLLSNLAPLMNKRRREAVKSSVVLQVTADGSGATIPAGSIVGTPRFQTLTEVVVAPSGTANVNAEAIEDGAIAAPAGTLTSIETPVLGWASVTNPADASVGRSRDSDGTLRANMLATSAAPNGTPEGIFTALVSIDGVTYAAVLENDTGATNGIGMPEHSIFPIVEGGADADIAAALLGSKAAGIQYTKDTDVPSADWRSVVVVNPANGQNVTVWFARPADLPITVQLNISTDSNFPADGQARIKQALIDYVSAWPIGKVLYASKLYTPVNTVPGVDINTLTIDSTDRATPAAFERLSLTDANISIVVV